MKKMQTDKVLDEKKENKVEVKKQKESTKKQNTLEVKPKVEKSVKETKLDEISKEKVADILKMAKENGKITYGELAHQLEDTNPEQIDRVFDAFEDLGVELLKDDEDLDVEPDLEDLQDVEDIKLEEIDLNNIEGVNIDDPVRMYYRV